MDFVGGEGLKGGVKNPAGCHKDVTNASNIVATRGLIGMGNIFQAGQKGPHARHPKP
jgi:hypothetical protein